MILFLQNLGGFAEFILKMFLRYKYSQIFFNYNKTQLTISFLFYEKVRSKNVCGWPSKGRAKCKIFDILSHLANVSKILKVCLGVDEVGAFFCYLFFAKKK